MKSYLNNCGTALSTSIVIATLVVLTSACISTKDCNDHPCSSTAMLTRVAEDHRSLPVFVLKANSFYSDLVLTYYYDAFDERRVRTYFGSSQRGPHIAEMITSWFLEGMDGAMSQSRRVVVDWANGSSASTCKVIPSNFPDDWYATYQTCLVWKKGDLYYRFYSTLSLDETLGIINSLEEVKP